MTDAPSPDAATVAGALPGAPWGRGRWAGGPRGGPGRHALYDRRVQGARERWPLPGRLVSALVSRPGLVLGLTGGTGPVERDGRVLHPGLQALLALGGVMQRATADRGGPDDPFVDRKRFSVSARLSMPIRTDVHAVGRTVPGPGGAPGIPVRIYRRFGVGVGRPHRRPSAIVFLHGGAWTVGDLDAYDPACRLVAAVTGCVVVAVDYRLAPEHPFPAAVEDSLAAYAWVQRNHALLGTAPGQVGVMGDSAGGNLAAVVAQETRPGGRSSAPDVPPPVAQGLLYPATDIRWGTESFRTLGPGGFYLTSASMETARARYLPDPADWEDPRASPLLAPDLAGLAPALVVTAGFDPLRDEGDAYAAALAGAGVEVEHRRHDDMIHGFFNMGIVPDCLALATEACDAMGSLMRRAARAGDA